MKLSDDVKAKLSNVQTTVQTTVSTGVSSVSSLSSTKGGEILQKVQTNVTLAASQAAEKVNKIQADYETKVNLDQFLKYEE